jgi:hypothetical protein
VKLYPNIILYWIMIVEAETRVKSKSLSNKLQYLYASVGSSPQKTVYTLSKIIWSLVRYQASNSSLAYLGRVQHGLMGNSDSPLATDVNELVYKGDRLLELEFSSAMEIHVRSGTLDFMQRSEFQWKRNANCGRCRSSSPTEISQRAILMKHRHQIQIITM